jgi:Lon protease-like protein
MAGALRRLPLFPLNAVLFPHAQTQLYVFEERYREMIRYCIETGQGFGFVLIRDGDEVGGEAEPYLVGTEAKLVQVQTHEDGSMNVRVEGTGRFRIRRFEQGFPYLVGLVEPIVEDEINNQNRLDALASRARELVREFIQSQFKRLDVTVSRVRMPEDPEQLSFVVANLLPIDDLAKQGMLQLTDTAERLSDLLPLLEEQVSQAQQPTYVKLSLEEMSEWIHPN